MNEDRIKEAEKVLAIQCLDGNWNYDPYMHGMANGMLLIVAIMREATPVYLDAPEEWKRKDVDKTDEIDKLANFIMAEVEGEPLQNEGAGTCAIRIIKEFQANLAGAKGL